MADTFAGITKAYRRVKCAARLYGWLIVSDSQASTDSRYLEVSRGSRTLSIRVSDHPAARPGTVSVDPSDASVSEVVGRLAAPPDFWSASDAAAWLSAMRARTLWARWEAEKERLYRARPGCEPSAETGETCARLEAEASALAARNDFIVSAGGRRIGPVDVEWLEQVAGSIEAARRD